MPGGYDINQYTRDVVRLKIVRQQQMYQITVGIHVHIFKYMT